MQPRKQALNSKPLNSNNSEVEESTVRIPKEQFKHGDVKITAPGVGKVSIVIH